MFADTLLDLDAPVSLEETPLARDSAWHGQLQLLASLPHPLMTLAPALTTAVCAGLRADFATMGLCHGMPPVPTAFWMDHISEAVLHWLGAHADALFDLTPLARQLATDGQAIRDQFDAPGWTAHPVFQAAFAPLGARWGMGVPLLDRQDRCLGFIYLYRAEAAGRFSDAEQNRLRAARDRLRGIGSARPHARNQALRTVATRSALLRVDAHGHIRARSADAYELLFLGQHQRVGSLTWAAPDLSALPPAVAERAQRLLSDPEPPAVDELTLRDDGGGMRYVLQRLLHAGADDPELIITLCHLEPIDLAVARQLTHWPLTPRERQLAVASAGSASQRDMADALGCSLGTLKGYTKSLYAKVGVGSRDELIARLLEAPGESGETARAFRSVGANASRPPVPTKLPGPARPTDG